MASQFFSKLPKRLILHQTTTHFFSTLSPPFPSFRAVKSAIKSESDPVKLAQLFSSSPPFATFRRHRLLFHLSIRKLARFKRFDLIDQILSTTLRKSTPQQLNSEEFWTRIIILYAEAGMTDNALQVVDKMLEQKACRCTEKSLCAILSVYLTNKIYDDRFHQAFVSVPAKLGVSPGVKSYNLALKAFCEAKDIGSARALLEKMENVAQVVPDIDSYNLLLGAYLAKGGNKSGFDEVVKEILKKGLEGNLTTYNHRILRLCKSKKGSRAKKLLDEMVSKGVKPNSATYDAIIFCFCKVGDLESAKRVLERMASDGYAFPPSYFNVMRQMVEEGEFGLALEMCKEILSRKWIPPFETMEGLVNGLVKISKIEEAKEVVEEMKLRLRGTAVDSWGKVEAALPVCKSSAS